MAKYTPSTAKNHMRRALLALLDPVPQVTLTDRVWDHFRSCCAYCGVPLDRRSRGGHLDHLVPVAAGGANGVYNLVLSCPQCNGDDKRDEDWERFLERLVPDTTLREARHAAITAWLSQAGPTHVESDLRPEAHAIIERSLAAFDAAVRELRELRGRGR
jgi:5-methylcytosine-specific restriction endonuclease McrA